MPLHFQKRFDDMALDAPYGTSVATKVNICPPPGQNNQDPKTDNFRM